MSRRNNKKTYNKSTSSNPTPKVVKTIPTPTRSRLNKSTTATAAPPEELLFGKQNYMLMGAGLALIILGFILMGGGGMDSPDVWDASKIYSPMRITVAPFLVLAGLIIEIFAIFKK